MRAIIGVDLGQQRLDFRVGVELGGFLFQDQVGAHAAAGEVLDAFIILGAVGMGVEVAAAVVADIFQELDQEEGGS